MRCGDFSGLDQDPRYNGPRLRIDRDVEQRPRKDSDETPTTSMHFELLLQFLSYESEQLTDKLLQTKSTTIKELRK